MFCIVKFLDEDDALGVVCAHWMSHEDTRCLYPNVRTNEARDKLIQRLVDPDPSWSLCRVKVLKKYDTFSRAHQQLRLAEDTSNLESEDENLQGRCRKRRKTNMRYPGEESEEDFSSSIIAPKNIKNISYPVPPKVIPESSLSFSPSPVHSEVEKPEMSPAQTIMFGKLVHWMADLSEKFQLMQQKIDLILDNQNKLLPLLNDEAEKDDYHLLLGNLPSTSEESFVQLNQMISKDSHFRNLLIKVFISVGGKDLRSNIHNMLRRVVADQVAELYSLSGKSTTKNVIKKAFVTTEVFKSIFVACQRIFANEATEVKVKETVGEWLHQAKVRKTRRLQRNEKTQDAPEEINEFL